ncbi:MAG TPA: molybdate ABC transporter substrate-binding protein, partial [bacterium]|nr:molybdate ABC transporter substrate-binding protein [bacterium]
QLSAGSTGVLYAQIKAGAPIDVFLSADQERPRLLEQEGLAVPGSRATYAQGVLVLWSQNAELLRGDGAAVLRGGHFAHLALANPETAPYGRAAQQALLALELWDSLQPKLVRGQSVSQTMQFIASGNAELGFLALSQVRSLHIEAAGSTWLVPDTLYRPILQDLVLLKAAPHPAAAREFVAFLRSAAARQRIEAMGYRVPAS